MAMTTLRDGAWANRDAVSFVVPHGRTKNPHLPIGS
jgi:hypothetical protein